MEQHERFSQLFSAYVEKNMMPEEKGAFFAMIRMGNYDHLLSQLVGERWQTEFPAWERENDDQHAELVYQAILGKVKVKPVTIFRRIAAAAAILVLVAAGSYFFFFDKPVVKEKQDSGILSNDVQPPSHNRATITLADGKMIYLDTSATGTLGNQGNMQLIKLADGKVCYQGTAHEKIYNTLTNPRGSKVVNLILADGSLIWLNAGSSVTYPVSFPGNERHVIVNGEAYFEVKPDKTRPFTVSKNENHITVLGTHFNVNAYDDEKEMSVTLLEGAVSVGTGVAGKTVILKPRQQAIIGRDLMVHSNVDVDEVMAWKNGSFYFSQADVPLIMRQVARWYNVEIEYVGEVPAGFYNGKPSRDITVAEMLKILEYSGIKITIEGNKIKVSQ